MSEYHTFILTQEGELNEYSKQIPTIREKISDLPPTAATFTLGKIGLQEIATAGLESKIVEFCGAWPMQDFLTGQSQTVKYVNPNYQHSRSYPGVIVECECGAIMNHGYDNELSGIDQHDHAEDCKPFHRMRARANLQEERYDEILRLTKLGWNGPEIANRLGYSKNRIGAFGRDMGLSFHDLRDRYRKVAGETYRRALENDIPAKKLGEIYDHDISTLGRWKREYGKPTPMASD